MSRVSLFEVTVKSQQSLSSPMSSSWKKKRTTLVSFNETQRSFSGSASALLAPPPAFGSTHNSRRINVAAYRDPNKSYALPSVTPLETLLKNLKIDPIEKAKQDAGITVQIKTSGIAIL